MGLRFSAAIRAFFIHLALSLLVAVILAAWVFGFWFPYPLYELAGGLALFGIIISVDVVCGPFFTALVFNPKKTRRELTLDLAIVVLIQLIALIYGICSLAQARPVVLAFETDRFVAVSAAEVDIARLSEAQPQWQTLSWSGPILLGTRLSRDGPEMLRSIEMSLQGLEPSARPGWWQSYDDSRSTVRLRMKSLLALYAGQATHTQIFIDSAVRKTGLSIQQVYYLPLVSRKSLEQWITLLDAEANIIGYAPVGGF